MLVAIAEVDEAADRAPDDEADPGLIGEMGHEVAASQDGERCDDPDDGAAEGAVEVRLRHAQYEDAERGDGEGGERADVCHLRDDADRCESSDDGNEDGTRNGHDVGRVVALVNLADVRRDHAVATHCEKDARLSVEQDEQHSRDTRNGADTDDG